MKIFINDRELPTKRLEFSKAQIMATQLPKTQINKLQFHTERFCHAVFTIFKDRGPGLQWLNGFSNVILSGKTSSDSDNPFFFHDDEPELDYQAYKKGALAAESLLECLDPDKPEKP